MVIAVRLLEGLPPYGPLATAFPADWGRLGREGTVVEFETEGGTWVANFGRGLGGIELAQLHPNKHDAVVIAAGDLWVVDGVERSAKLLLPAIETVFEVRDPEGWVFNRQGLALARFGPDGLMWHTRRLSWDGFDQLKVGGSEVTGLAWSPMDNQWYPFRVDLTTGRSTGGSVFDEDREGWERLAE
jgi:hypothetical protein